MATSNQEASALAALINEKEIDGDTIAAALFHADRVEPIRRRAV